MLLWVALKTWQSRVSHFNWMFWPCHFDYSFLVWPQGFLKNSFNYFFGKNKPVTGLNVMKKKWHGTRGTTGQLHALGGAMAWDMDRGQLWWQLFLVPLHFLPDYGTQGCCTGQPHRPPPQLQRTLHRTLARLFIVSTWILPIIMSRGHDS